MASKKHLLKTQPMQIFPWTIPGDFPGGVSKLFLNTIFFYRYFDRSVAPVINIATRKHLL